MASNRVYDGDPFLQSVACSDPATPATGGPVRYGSMTGVCLVSEDSAGLASVDFGNNAYSLSVAAVDDNGNTTITAGQNLFYVDADTPKLSKKSSGYFFGIALEANAGSGTTTTIKVLHVNSPGSGTLGSGTVGTTNLAAGAVTAAKLGTTLGTGFIPMDVATVHILATNNLLSTSEGGFPDTNTDPILQRINGATDIALRLVWAAASVVEVQFSPVPKPPDMDDTATLLVNLLISKDTNTDNTAVVAVKIFDGIGDSNAGSNTAALATAAITKYAVTMAAADLLTYPGFLSVALVPGSHGTDAVRLHAAWIEYTRK